MIEMILAMVIVTLLLTALAAALNASAVNMKVNENSFKVINNARRCLFRITTELRTASSVAVFEEAGWCSIQTAEGSFVSYCHSDSSEKLYLIKGSKWYTMCEGVTDMTFTKGLHPEDPGKVRNVRISMTIQSGDIKKKISTAAVIRRNLD